MLSSSHLQGLTQPVTGAVRETGESRVSPLRLYNLLNNLGQLLPLLVGQLERGSSIDSYLLAAGISQIIEDYLHPDPFLLSKVAKSLARFPDPLGSLATRFAKWFSRIALRVFLYKASIHHVLQWRTQVAHLVLELANLVACPNNSSSHLPEQLVSDGKTLLAAAKDLPTRLIGEVIRLPGCFQSFDQQPADLEQLVRDLVMHYPDIRVPLVVIGIRTSGSYLAPLCTAFLKARGYDVQTLTLRPGHELLPSEEVVLKNLARREGLAIITDDPPATGDTLVQVATELERYGILSHSIILLLGLFGSRDTLPRVLQKYPSVLLPWDEWAIHKQLTPCAVHSALDGFLNPAVKVTGISQLSFPDRRLLRDHVHALYRVHLTDSFTGSLKKVQVFVKGVGFGYFGEYSRAVVEPLYQFLPQVFGIDSGLIYQVEPPSECRFSAITPSMEEIFARAMAAYVVARNRALSVANDMSLHLLGQRPVWEVASNIVSRVFGSGWRQMRILAVDRIIKSLMRVEHPSIIDGNMALSHWFVDDTAKELHLKKADFDERAFGHLDLYCYDPIFDLAGLAVSSQNNEFTRDLVLAYQEFSSDFVPPERWLLYQLVHLLELRHVEEVKSRWEHRPYCNEPSWIARALSRAVQSYFAETFFKGLMPNSSGPICAIDLDGVLETSWLGFPAITPAGALTLRALILHGFRPILATGRSLDEVRERCRTYHLSGGVAEYGAAVYIQNTGDFRLLLSNQERANLDRLRRTISEVEGIHSDPDYENSVRAFCLDSAGHKHGLSTEQADAILARSQVQQPMRVVPGYAQTDFAITRIDKRIGLDVLSRELGAGASGNSRPLAFAVGDTASDLSMFQIAEIACAPANADAAVKNAGVKVLKQPYQLGLAMATARLLGHMPGECAICATPPFSPETQMLMTVFAARETGKLGRIWRALQLVGTVARL